MLRAMLKPCPTLSPSHLHLCLDSHAALGSWEPGFNHETPETQPARPGPRFSTMHEVLSQPSSRGPAGSLKAAALMGDTCKPCPLQAST